MAALFYESWLKIYQQFDLINPRTVSDVVASLRGEEMWLGTVYGFGSPANIRVLSVSVEDAIDALKTQRGLVEKENGLVLTHRGMNERIRLEKMCSED